MSITGQWPPICLMPRRDYSEPNSCYSGRMMNVLNQWRGSAFWRILIRGHQKCRVLKWNISTSLFSKNMKGRIPTHLRFFLKLRNCFTLHDPGVDMRSFPWASVKETKMSHFHSEQQRRLTRSYWKMFVSNYDPVVAIYNALWSFNTGLLVIAKKCEMFPFQWHDQSAIRPDSEFAKSDTFEPIAIFSLSLCQLPQWWRVNIHPVVCDKTLSTVMSGLSWK
jgi:hypothetical protein